MFKKIISVFGFASTVLSQGYP